MTPIAHYPIGTPGQPWGPAELAQWRARQVRQRSYADDVLARRATAAYAALTYFSTARWPMATNAIPLMAVRNRHAGAWQPGLPTVLVTGGVHGYETSGVQGALHFLPSMRSVCGPGQPAGGALREPLGV
jgi:hypothetical protein